MSGASPLVRSALQVGTSIVLPLLVFLGVGRWLDLQRGTSPLFLLVGLVLSFVITFAVLMRIVRTAAREQRHE